MLTYMCVFECMCIAVNAGELNLPMLIILMCGCGVSTTENCARGYSSQLHTVGR